MLLNTPTRTLEVLMVEVKTTTEMDILVHYEDDYQEQVDRPVEQASVTAGVTAVTIVPAPLANTARRIKDVTICNVDTIVHTVKVRLADTGPSYKYLVVYTLQPNETLQYTADRGWNRVDTSASILASYATIAYADLLIKKPAFLAMNLANQTITSAVLTKVNFTNELFDTDGQFANSRFTCVTPGYYEFYAGIINEDTVAPSGELTYFYKNGAAFWQFATLTGVGNKPNSGVITLQLAAADYVEIYGQITGTAPFFRYIDTTRRCMFGGHFVRSA